MNTQQRIGRNIKKLREMSGKTQSQYGQEFKQYGENFVMTRSRICDLEAGRFMPNAGIIVMIAKHHSVSTDSILLD